MTLKYLMKLPGRKMDNNKRQDRSSTFQNVHYFELDLVRTKLFRKLLPPISAGQLNERHALLPSALR